MDSSSGEESSSSSSDSDDCIMLSDSEVPPSPEAEEDPTNSGKIIIKFKLFGDSSKQIYNSPIAYS